uniref:Retrovirus-related Pol polyprotein from transposon TNT 1-94 n=1 Tax=Cajanus cajan TaxID=3821 RepID=A0A151S9G9_CAJCA|nr:Retrovirus-related Pol polyprotein from transposon TNT 1-94 [Cajanus cajan]
MDILHECRLLGCKPSDFPMDQNHKLALADGPAYDDPTHYRRLVGRLLYLTITRPELSYAVHTLSQFLQHPLQEHYDAVLRVLRYIKGNPGQGLLIRSTCDLHLRAYCDSDWASCPITRRSITGYFITLGQSPISWKSKKQHTISRSSAEVEYHSMAAATSELLWIKAFLQDLGVSHSMPMTLYCDSQSAIHIASNPVFHERTKHIELGCHFVREHMMSKTISTQHIRTDSQPTDILTKALGRKQFQFLLSKLDISSLHAPT